MSDNFIQFAVGAAPVGTGTDTATLTGVTAGNAIVAYLFDGNTTVTPTTKTVTDGQGSYTIQSPSAIDVTNNVWVQQFVLENANAGTHVAVGNINAGQGCFLVLVEVGTTSNPSFSGANAQFQNSPGTGADAISSGTVTVTGNATLVAISTDSASASTSNEPTAGTGFTSRANNANGTIGAWRLETKAVSANASGTFTAITGTDSYVTAAIAILNGGGGAPLITSQPQNQTTNSGSTATFTVVAQALGGGLSYQWQDNRTGVFTNVSGGSGATTTSYTTPNADQSFQGRTYVCVVTGSNGATTSNPVTLGVIGFPVYLWSTALPTGDDVWLRDPTQAGAGTGTAALTAVTGTGSAGTLAPSLTLALTGVSGTGSVGTVAPALSLALIGNTGTGSAGTVTPNNSVPLTAVAGTGSVGTAVPTLSLGLTAVTGTGSVGTVLPATVVPLTGVTGAGSVGTVSASGAVTAALTGVTGTGSVGALGPATDKALSAVSGTGSVGTVVPALSLTLGALSATGSAGTLTPSTVIALTGVSATGSVGTVTVQSSDVTIAMTGVSALGSVGLLIASGGDVATTTNSGGTLPQKKNKKQKQKEFDRDEARDILRSFDALSGPLRRQIVEEVAEVVQPVVEEVAPVVEDDEEDELFLLLHA